jgi:hypothetical protein
MTMNPTSKVLGLLLAALVLLGCSDPEAPSFSLLKDAPTDAAEDTSAEAERLRKMQLLTVLDEDDQPEEISAEDLTELIFDECDLQLVGCQWSCRELCYGDYYTCAAERILAMTKPQATMPKVGSYAVPMQRPSATADLAQKGSRYATAAGINYHAALWAMENVFNGMNPLVQCSPSHADDVSAETGMTNGMHAGAAFVRAFDVFKALGDAQVQSALDTSDAELNSTGSTPLASQRAIRDWRLKAAQALGGNATSLPFGDNGAFCSRPTATPEVKAAIAVLRDAALDPVALLSNLTTEQLLNGSGNTVANGSVKQRLLAFYDSPSLSQGKSIQDVYSLDLATFEDARAILKEEVAAFSRSKTAVLENARKRPDGSSSGYFSYVATSAAPSRLPAAYYGALARLPGGTREPWNGSKTLPPDALGDYAFRYEGFLVGARSAVANQAGFDPSLRGTTIGPVAMLQAGGQLLGRLDYVVSSPACTQFACTRYAGITVQGFAAAEVRLLHGEDQLRCAVQGSIEGAPCTLSLATLTDATPASGYSVAASKLLAHTSDRIYLVRPKRIVSNPLPGDYEALIGFTAAAVESSQGGDFPIIAGHDERLAAVLEPSAEWCARPRLNCDLTSFDERIPLEDELTDDSNGVENSWRHYLELAKVAADRADTLGVEYINASLADAERSEVVELRREQQRAQADARLQELQSLCGFTSDTRSLLAKITENGAIVATGDGDCTTSAECGSGFSCIDEVCVLDIQKLLDSYDNSPIAGQSADPDIQRIRDCLDKSPTVPFVSLGDRPLCLWYDTANPNLICSGAPRGECPKVLPAPEEGMPVPTCAAVLTAMPAMGVTSAETKHLGYFAMSTDGPTDDEEDLYRTLPDSLNRSAWKSKGEEIRRANILDPYRIADVVAGLDWESRYDDYGAILFHGSPIYQTGSASDGPVTGRWPCGSDLDSPLTSESMSSYDCSDSTERRWVHAKMLKAVAAAKILVPRISDEFDESGRLLVRFGAINHGFLADEVKDCDGSQSFTTPEGLGFTRSTCSSGTHYNGYAGSFFAHQSKLPLEWSEYPRWLGLRGLHPGPTGGWIANSLDGEGSPTQNIIKLAWESDVPVIPGAETGDSINVLELSINDFLRGLGLVGLQAAKPLQIQLDVAPKVKTVEDLEGVSLYLNELAKSIRDSAGSAIFSNVPAKVEDALRGEQATGSYPQFGGQMAVSIASARGALLRIRQNGPLIANEIEQLGTDIRDLKILLRKSAIRQDLAGLQFASTMQDRLTSCATAITNGIGLDVLKGAGNALGAAITCANSISQIGIASDIAALSKEDAKLDGELAVNDFGAKFSSHATAMQTFALNLAQAQDEFDSALATIESTRSKAKSALVDALLSNSFQAQHEAEVSTVTENLATGRQQRYDAALKNARRMAFLAKRAIEQRLGVRLADLTEDYPLVEAPQKWESTACTFSGLNYAKLAEANPEAPQSLANGFIGEYVNKLENFVESYRLEHNFHEGTDTAIISLRDDIMNVRAACEVGGPNLLYNAGQLNEGTLPGWRRHECPTEEVDEVEQPMPNCIDVATLSPGPVFANEASARTTGYSLVFGANSSSDSALVQRVDLKGGVYRLTWYTKESGTSAGGAGAGVVLSSATPANVDVIDDGTVAPPETGGWYRRFKVFRLDTQDVVELGFRKPSSGSTTITVSAPMLESLPDVGVELALLPFANTGDKLTQILPACQDTDGAAFRATRWNRTCMKLCADGFASECSSGRSEEYCYREASFGFGQRDIQLGKVFNFSGFARGNFNYRIESVGLNFVGTNVRNCEDSEVPQPCYSGGFVPYSLAHVGPFFVRNYTGADVEAHVFDGNIEHARGLATERYLANPLSESDRSLMEQYTRRELSGRPLDGNFVLRVWEEEGVDFDAIEDVQVVLNYRYWTRFD